VTFKQTLVFMSASERKAVAIPPDIVHRLKRYVPESTKKAKPATP
jgi:acyl-CoA thioesterase FadM